MVDRPGVIEPTLWGALHFLGDPQCSRCGFLLPTDPGPTCGACAALAYDDNARKLVLDLKRGGRREGLPVFARWMSAVAVDALQRANFIAPTPMHWTRLAVRSFNQAAWLAQALSHASGKPWKPGALARVKRRKARPGFGLGTAPQRRRGDQGEGALCRKDYPSGG